jgi:hemoglobin
MSMFDRCGGFATVRKVVSALYDRILDSEILQKHSADVDMRALLDHQTKFIASLMGGPAPYTDQVLQRLHAPLNISRTEFAEMASLPRETLTTPTTHGYGPSLNRTLDEEGHRWH